MPMHTSPLAGKHILLAMTGGIAGYKIAELTRLLVKAGATVQVMMTEAAEQFITAVTMQALSGRPVYTSQWDTRPANNMAHINLSRDADAMVVAPASADAIAALAQGRADDLISLTALARRIGECPLHQTVLEGMKADDGGHTPGLHHARQLPEHRFQHPQLIVDGDPQPLKTAGGRVDPDVAHARHGPT